MANRLGIELLPYVCRVVEIQAGAGWSGRSRGSGGKVRAYHEIPRSPGNPAGLTADLKRALGRRAAADAHVILWGTRAHHQVMNLPPADPADLLAMARRQARSAPGAPPAPSAGGFADDIVAGESQGAGTRQVCYVSLPAGEVESGLQPLADAGVRVRSVATPAVAHGALVRQRQGAFSDSVTAVLAVNATTTALTVLNGVVPLFAREMPWGHETDPSDGAAFVGRLVSEVRRSLVYVKQSTRVEASHVLVCGDMPDLRALTGPLMNELNVEVETLDSPDGLDPAQLPEEARSRLGALRTAWAVAADESSPVNLLPREERTVKVSRQSQLRLGSAVAAGLVIAAAAWGVAYYLASSARTRLDQLRQQSATLEPETQRIDAARRLGTVVEARGAALSAFATQGPRLARVLETLSQHAPTSVAITVLRAEPSAGAWRLRVEGQAEGSDPADAQASFNAFLKSLDSSALLGPPVAPPSISVSTRDSAPAQSDAPTEPAATQQYRVEVGRRTEGSTQVARQRYYDEVRNGRFYRVWLPDPPPVADPEEDRLDLATRGVAGTPAPAVANTRRADQPKPRTSASVLEFVLEYEVRK